MLRCLGALLLALGAARLEAANDLPQLYWRDYCAGIQHCISQQSALCRTPGEGKVEYPRDHCELFSELGARGLDPLSRESRLLYSFLGRPRRVSYSVSGTLPLPPQAMDYLVSHLPFTVALMNAKADTRYHVRYLDRARSRFFAGDGDGIEGRFRWSARADNGRRNVLFGRGRISTLGLKLRGRALFLFDYAPLGNANTAYEVTCITFPGNFLTHAIMDSGLVRGMIEQRMADAIDTLRAPIVAYHRAGPDDPAGSAPESVAFSNLLIRAQPPGGRP